MTPRKKRLHFEHAWSLQANLKQYKVNILGDSPSINLTTGLGINKKVIDSPL